MAIILGITDIIKVTDEHTYNVELGHVAVEREKGNASVKMGGSDPAKFVPNINASKWDDESFLNINYPGTVVSAERETFISDKIELSVGGLTHRYFKKNDSDLKYDVVIPAKPLSNHFVFDIKFSENLKFIHQGTAEEEWLIQSQNETVPVFGKTTLEEFEKIFHRPDNIINSYAVYGASKNNKYLTGKFCHIERVKFVDARGDEIWAEQLIEVTARGLATWTITVDQTWLDGAAYPIVIDPVFGYNTIGGSSVQPGATFFGGIFATPTTGGSIDNIQIYAEKTGGNPYVIMGLYEDSGSGDLDLQDLLSANSVAKILPSQPAWIQDTAITGNVVGGTYEWLATETMAGWEVYFDTGVGLEEARYTSVTYDGVLPDPAPDSLGYYNSELSFYINFTEAAGTTETITTSLDALVKGTISKTLSLDSLLQKSIPVTLSIDAILANLVTISGDLDAQLFKSYTKTLSIDSLLQRLGVTTSLSIDALLQKAGTKDVSLDAILYEVTSGQETVAIDALLNKSGVVAQLNIDALLQRTTTETLSIDAMLFETITKTLSIDALLTVLKTISGDLDAQLFKSYTKDLSMDGLLQRLGVTTSVSVDAVLSKAGTEDVSLDSLLQKRTLKDTSLDAILFTIGSGQVFTSIDALLLKTITNSLVFDAYLQKQGIGTLALDAHISKLETLSTSMDAILLGGGTISEVSLDALLQKLQLQTASLDAMLYSGQILTASLDAIVRGTLTATVDFDALLQKQGTTSTLLDAIIYSALAVATAKYDFVSSLVKPGFACSLEKPDFVCNLVKPDFVYSA